MFKKEYVIYPILGLIILGLAVYSFVLHGDNVFYRTKTLDSIKQMTYVQSMYEYFSEDYLKCNEFRKKQKQLNEWLVYNPRMIGDCVSKDDTTKPFYISANNLPEANTTILYQGHGVKFEIPYNKDWSSEKCFISLYSENANYDSRIVRFGKPAGWESSDEFTLFFEEKVPKEEYLNTLKNYSGFKDFREINLGDFDILTYTETGMSDLRSYIIFGKEYNYEFQTYLDNDKKIEDIIKTFEIIL